MIQYMRIAIALWIPLSAAFIGCGADGSAQPAPSSSRFRFNLQPGSVIAREGEEGEALRGYFTVTDRKEQSAQFLFYLEVSKLQFHSASFALTATEGRVSAKPGLLQLNIVAIGSLNGLPIELRGGGGPTTYSDGLPRRQVPAALHDVLLQAGEGVVVRINAQRAD